VSRSWPVGLIPLVVALSGCSTRQPHAEYAGATAQRLVTHSIHKFARMLSDEPFEPMRGKKVLL